MDPKLTREHLPHTHTHPTESGVKRTRYLFVMLVQNPRNKYRLLKNMMKRIRVWHCQFWKDTASEFKNLIGRSEKQFHWLFQIFPPVLSELYDSYITRNCSPIVPFCCFIICSTFWFQGHSISMTLTATEIMAETNFGILNN